MKKIIRWISEVTGVAQKIRVEAYKEVGTNMHQYASWFTGGLMVEGHKYDMSNILEEYPKWCLNEGRPHLYGGQFDDLRQKLWKLSDEGKSIILENNKKHYRKGVD